MSVVGNNQAKIQNDKHLYHTVGISKKNFVWEKVVSDHVIVDGVTFDNGLLSVRCHVEIPEHQKPKTFQIN